MTPNQNDNSANPGPGRALQLFLRSFLASALLAATAASWANGIGDNSSWQFRTATDKAVQNATLDMTERKRGGYYQSFQTINTTYIGRQYNCAVSATSAGNGGSNGMTANTSSPGVNNTGSTAASSGANSATNGMGYGDVSGLASLSPSAGQLANTQSNGGAVNAGVAGSATSAVTGAVAAGGGRSDLVLNSDQLNQNSQQLATVTGSTACTGSLN
ncbi:MAG: hypothetical protein JWQ76_4139 [Ramlibacter sp.]|nr:hypothetical protein [Ramlibacter sp.]